MIHQYKSCLLYTSFLHISLSYMLVISGKRVPSSSMLGPIKGDGTKDEIWSVIIIKMCIRDRYYRTGKNGK